MNKEIIEVWNVVPANGNILGREIPMGDVINLYGVNANVYGIKRHKVPGTKETFAEIGTEAVRDFIYYMVSCDPQKQAWYHVSKQESTLREPAQNKSGRY